ncbi:MAG: putative sulfate exporter family transporter [Deltaproteobacteria bacterium]|nr:putative sulfate exporter family transporter [Deltaproteobacteria bacterium]
MPPRVKTKLLTTEDYWAIWLGMAVIALSLGFYFAGDTLAGWTVTPKGWAGVAEIGADFARAWPAYLGIYAALGAAFAASAWVMGRDVRQFIAGYTILFLGSLGIFYLAGWTVMKKADLGAPLLALLIGLAIGNLRGLPAWLKTALRTEYYIKTGIVLLGATLPLSLIVTAGPVAFLQATIVSVGTWLTIYLAATRLFRLDPRFGAVLGTGGAVCGVSGSIAVGGAVRADEKHISIGIAVVSVWAIVMILALTAATKMMVPSLMSPGVAGAWVGTSEYADAAGFAVVAELATKHGDGPIHTFTLMKVIGRDIWIGIWSLVLSVVSVVYWERREGASRLRAGVVWERFPKFVLGFFAASLIVSAVVATGPKQWVGEAKLEDTYKAETGKERYRADFAAYAVPEKLRDRFSFDAAAKVIRFRGKMSYGELGELLGTATTKDQRSALKQLHYKSDWYESHLSERAIAPIKQIRSWAFVLCFLCIGLATRFRDLFTFGLKPFWAFTIGVLVNVPLGFLLSRYVFDGFWNAIK